MGVADVVIPEPEGGAHTNTQDTITAVGAALHSQLEELEALPLERLLDMRYQKYRAIGAFQLAKQRDLGLNEDEALPFE